MHGHPKLRGVDDEQLGPGGPEEDELVAGLEFAEVGEASRPFHRREEDLRAEFIDVVDAHDLGRVGKVQLAVGLRTDES
uniref:Uncharacterized protein n=1 Tax=Steinernema glaseri TaxID=37863 RepID=A0A1I8A9R8_9BILA